MNDALITFLRARLTEDEYLAHRFAATGQADWDAEMLGLLWWYGPGDAPQSRPATDPTIQHVARHDPARVLREVAAKRRILEKHAKCSCPEPLWLATVYSDHPDYRDEWKP